MAGLWDEEFHPSSCEGVSAKTLRAENSLFFAFCLPPRHRRLRCVRVAMVDGVRRPIGRATGSRSCGRRRRRQVPTPDDRYGTRGRRDCHFELAAPVTSSPATTMSAATTWASPASSGCPVRRTRGQAGARTGSGTERAGVGGRQVPIFRRPIRNRGSARLSLRTGRAGREQSWYNVSAAPAASSPAPRCPPRRPGRRLRQADARSGGCSNVIRH
jgi:hypothetical protein